MQRRDLKRDSNVSCKLEESDKAHCSVDLPTSCLDPLEPKLGFSHMSIFSQSAERAARAAPNGVKKGATFLLVFRCLNHTASSRKAFNGVQKGQVHSKKHKPSKNIFVDDRLRGHHPRALTCGGAVANRLRRRTSDQTVLGSNPAVAAALSPWTRLFTPIVSRRNLHTSFC